MWAKVKKLKIFKCVKNFKLHRILCRPPSEVARTLETGVWLQGGESYLQVVNSLIEGASPLSISLEFRTFSANGLLVALFSQDMAQVRDHVTWSCDSCKCHVTCRGWQLW